MIAPGFDRGRDDERIRFLWRIREYTDSRTEPVAVGVREFEEDDGAPLIGVARRDGLPVPLPTVAMVHEEPADYGADAQKEEQASGDG